jgi:hypothetical protein
MLNNEEDHKIRGDRYPAKQNYPRLHGFFIADVVERIQSRRQCSQRIIEFTERDTDHCAAGEYYFFNDICLQQFRVSRVAG